MNSFDAPYMGFNIELKYLPNIKNALKKAIKEMPSKDVGNIMTLLNTKNFKQFEARIDIANEYVIDDIIKFIDSYNISNEARKIFKKKIIQEMAEKGYLVNDPETIFQDEDLYLPKQKAKTITSEEYIQGSINNNYISRGKTKKVTKRRRDSRGRFLPNK